MKRKSKTCSTGHDTGLSYVRSLHHIMKEEKLRKYQKKRARMGRLGERLARVAKLSAKSSFVIAQRVSALQEKFDHAKAVLTRLHAAGTRASR